MNRDELITTLFDTMDIAKRSMHGRLQTILSGQSVSHTQLELLFTIRHLQPISPKALAEKLHLTPGAISQLMDVLDQQQLITRETDPQDRRRQSLRVSEQGAALLKGIEKRRRDVMESVMSDLSDEELAVWLRIQQKLINEFQAVQTAAHERSTT